MVGKFRMAAYSQDIGARMAKHVGVPHSNFSETPGLVKHVYLEFPIKSGPYKWPYMGNWGYFTPTKKGVMGKPPFPGFSMGKTLEFYTEKHMDVAAEVDA